MLWFSKFVKEHETFGFAIDVDSHNNLIAIANSFNEKTYKNITKKE